MTTSRTRGFTLVELLVVIAIIALLSGVIFAVMKSTRTRARDTQRIANARQVALALEQYEHTTGTYRVAGAGFQGTGEGYIAKADEGDYSTSLAAALKQQGYFSADTIKDPFYNDDNYFLGMCSTTNAFALFLKVEQEDIRMASSTIRNACDGVQADALGFNYIASIGGGSSALVAGGADGGAALVATADIDGPVATATFVTSMFSFPWIEGVPSTQTQESVPTLNWTAPVNNSGSAITGYKIYRSTTPNPTTVYQTLGNVLTYKDTGAVRGATNYYKIVALNAVGGEGQFGPEVSAVVPGPIGSMQTFTGTGDRPFGLAFDGTYIYSANYGGNSVSRITKTGTISLLGNLNGAPVAAAYYSGTGYLYVTTQNTNEIRIIRLTDGVNIASYGSNTTAQGIAFSGSDVCTANYGANNMTIRQTSSTGDWRCTVGSQPRGIAYDRRGNLWVTNSGSNNVTRIAAGCVATTISVGTTPIGIVHDGNNLWVANQGSSSVTKISATGLNVLGTYALPAGSAPYNLAYDGTYVWSANSGTNSVSRIASDGTVTTYSGTGARPQGIVFDGTHIWVSNFDDDSMTRVVTK